MCNRDGRPSCIAENASSYPTFLSSLKQRFAGLHSVDSVRRFSGNALVEYDIEASWVQQSSERSLAEPSVLAPGFGQNGQEPTVAACDVLHVLLRAQLGVC